MIDLQTQLCTTDSYNYLCIHTKNSRSTTPTHVRYNIDITVQCQYMFTIIAWRVCTWLDSKGERSCAIKPYIILQNSHFVRASCIQWFVQSLFGVEHLREQQGVHSRIGSLSSTENLPTRHSKWPLHVSIVHHMTCLWFWSTWHCIAIC